MPDKIDQINKLIKALPLPKKGLYKLKDNINLDDYIAILQSKRENKTYTIDASLLNQGGGSSALLPNGAKYLTESRDLQADDAGYILFLLSETEPVVLTIPEISPLQVGDNFEIILPESGDWQNSGFIWSGELIKPEITESVFFITTTFGGNPYSLPISTLFTEGKTAFKYLYDQLQNAIPLSGTETDKPVTGNIEVNNGFSLYSNGVDSGSYSAYILDDIVATINAFDNYSGNGSSFVVGSNYAFISSTNPLSVGITGIQDFTPNITDLDYTQKIYVGFRGTATLSSGTVTVATDKILTGYKIYVSVNTPSGTQGFLSAPTGSIVDATSFVINSTSVLDDSTVNWWIAP